MDPRPLVGEPLALDLLNTRWNSHAGPLDLLDSLEGLAVWLDSAGLAGPAKPDQPTLAALCEVREALLVLVDGGCDEPTDATAEATLALNRFLTCGWIRRSLGHNGPEAAAETEAPHQLPAWLAAADYLRLLEENPSRIRRCAHPDCVLHFYDVSKNGTRRWCSMAGCGNRAKASRHYERQKQRGS